MSSPILSDISQNDTEMLEEQCYEIQQRHKKKQWLLACLKEAVEACHIKCIAQKARKKVEAKAKEDAKK